MMENSIKSITQKLALKIDHELREGILKYWINNTVDNQNGGFYGRVNNDGRVEPDAPKHLILNTRILWSFARAYNHYKEDIYLEMADRAYNYIITRFWDPVYDGFFWELDCTGRVTKTKKQIYGQAFGIYAFSEYVKARGDKTALDFAEKTFLKIEKHGLDKKHNGYFEAFSREWEEIRDVRLSDDDMNEKKSNNTHLHIMEAYSGYYKVRKEQVVKERLQNIVDIMLERIMDKKTCRFTLFFDEAWNKKSSTISYGHEIEAAWLLYDALETLDDPVFGSSREKLVLKIADNCHKEYLDGENGLNGMFNERSGSGEVDRDKVWWVQAEACVGFFNAFQLTRQKRYLKTVHNIWNFIDRVMIDKKNGEWFWYDPRFTAKKKINTKINEWKSIYHNSRACIELLERIDNEIKIQKDERKGADNEGHILKTT